MGAGGRYPHPKYVWSPAGGWWSQPKNWKQNTAVTFLGILGAAGWISWIMQRNMDKVDQNPRRIRKITTPQPLSET